MIVTSVQESDADDAHLERAVLAGARELGLSPDPADIKRLVAYLRLLEKWNRTYNLTAIRDVSQMVTGHLLDSLSVLAHLRGRTLADIGSGAGLPGLPLALVKPSLSVTMIDSNQKKAAFVQHAIATLGISNARAYCIRAQEHRPVDTYDAAIARAFSTLRELVAAAGHLINVSGVLVAMKGAVPEDEIADLPEGWKMHDLVKLTIPGLNVQRHLVIVGRTR